MPPLPTRLLPAGLLAAAAALPLAAAPAAVAAPRHHHHGHHHHVRTARAKSAQAVRIAFAAPTRQRSLSGRVRCRVDTGGLGLRSIRFSLDGQLLNVDHLAPYSCRSAGSSLLDTRKVANGDHVLVATATDAAGQVTTTQTTVQVLNPPAPTPPSATPPVAVAASAPAAASAPGVSDASSGTLFTDGFQSGTFGNWQLQQSASAPGRIQLVPDPLDPSHTVARFEVQGGDQWTAGGGDATARSEIGYIGNKAQEGQERAYSWSTMFAADYPSSPPWQVFFQWHNDGTGTPPLNMYIRGETLGLLTGPQANYRVLWSTPLVRGQWLPFSVRVKWSSDPNVGWVEVWYGGQQVLQRTPVATMYPGLANYVKLGLYRDQSIQPTGVVYDSDVKITS